MIWPFKKNRSLPELLECLENPDLRVRKEGLQGLVDSEDPATNSLIMGGFPRLSSLPNDVQMLFLELVGRRGIEEAVPVLRKLLDEDDPEIRITALRALTRIPTQQSLDAFLGLLADDDLEIRREVRQAIAKVFGEKAMGALVRAAARDQNSPLYFEIVSLFEELGFFEKLKDTFEHPDIEVRKFQFGNLARFHRPDFSPLFREFFNDLREDGFREKVKTALREYTLEELMPHLRENLLEDPGKPLLGLIEDVIIARFPEAKEQILHLAAEIPKPEIRLDLLERILRKPDTFLFLPAFELIDDSLPQIRTLVTDALLKLYHTVRHRLGDPHEQNKAFLKKELDTWFRTVAQRIDKESGDMLGVYGRLLLTMAQDRPEALVPSLPRLLSQQFHVTLKHLSAWDKGVVEQLLDDAVKKDRSVGTLLVNGFVSQPTPELVRIILKNFQNLEKSDVTAFRKSFANRALNGKVPSFLDDPDPAIRLAALELFADGGNESFAARIEEKCKDPSPEVRLKALQIARLNRHPKASQLLEEATTDPAAIVALQALKDLKSMVVGDRYTKLLARAINSPSEEIRNYALHEVAKVTQQKYIENYNALPPKVRKLAGSALLKLDASFVDHLIGELRSLDPDSRLRAAMIMENLQTGGKGREALLAGMKDPSKMVRAAIVKTLGVMGDRTLLSHLIEFFNDPDERVRANAIEAVSGIGDDRAVKMLLPFLEDSNNRIRANAALAVWQIGKINIIPVLSKMLMSRETLMKASALWVLGEIKSEMYVSMIFSHVRDREELVRVNALRAIAKIKPEILKPLLPQLRADSSAEIKRLVADLSYKII
jgi:HEAT repeat protein